jgi:hypothetical protein
MRADAVVYYRVVDPFKAIVNVQDYRFAVAQVAQTSLRAVTGRSDMDRLLAEREQVNAELKDVIDEPTEQPRGIRVERIEVKDVSLPEAMKRPMSRQAEAERERRARIIGADGEYQTARKLAQAASVLAADPAALHLRLLQTVAEVAAEKNSPRHHRARPGGSAALPRPGSFRGWPGLSVSGEARPQPVVQAEAGQHENAGRQPSSLLCRRGTSCQLAAPCSSRRTGGTAPCGGGTAAVKIMRGRRCHRRPCSAQQVPRRCRVPGRWAPATEGAP